MSLPKIQPGYKRNYWRCVARVHPRRGCNRVYFKDYVPHSLSNPILTIDCGHDAHQYLVPITRRDFYAEIRRARG